jgi:anti-sigma B factor antagonist
MSDQAGAASITFERNGDAAVARPQMKMMDDQALKTLIRMIEQTAGPDSGVGLVVLDLSRVTILPSLALGLLVQISNTCKGRQQKLKLAGLQPQIRQVFAITKLDRVFELAPSVEAAIE